jgi:small subunit ribosomal protein S6
VAIQRHYETTVIINGALEDDNIQQVVERTTDFITRNGGSITNADHWGRKRLAYPINKKNTGYYVRLDIDGPTELSALMDRFFFLEENIIRNLTLRFDAAELKERDETRARMAAAGTEDGLPATDEESNDRGDRGGDRGDRGGDRDNRGGGR